MNKLILTERKHKYSFGKIQIEVVEMLNSIVNINIYDWNRTENPLLKSKTVRKTLDTIDEIGEIKGLLKEVEDVYMY